MEAAVRGGGEGAGEEVRAERHCRGVGGLASDERVWRSGVRRDWLADARGWGWRWMWLRSGGCLADESADGREWERSQGY